MCIRKFYFKKKETGKAIIYRKCGETEQSKVSGTHSAVGVRVALKKGRATFYLKSMLSAFTAGRNF